jgi:hypothetical protein
MRRQLGMSPVSSPIAAGLSPIRDRTSTGGSVYAHSHAHRPGSQGGSHRVLKSQPGESTSIAINSSRRRPSLNPREEAPLRIPTNGSGVNAASSARYPSPISTRYPPSAAVNTSVDATACLTCDLRIVLGTPKFGETLGRQPSELRNVALHDLVIDSDRPQVYQLARQMREEASNRTQSASLPTDEEILAVGERELFMAMQTTPTVAHGQRRLTLHLHRSDGTHLRVSIRAMLSFPTTSQISVVVVVFEQTARGIPAPLQLQRPVRPLQNMLSRSLLICWQGSEGNFQESAYQHTGQQTPLPPRTSSQHHLQGAPPGPQSPFWHPPPVDPMSNSHRNSRPRTMSDSLRPFGPYGSSRSPGTPSYLGQPLSPIHPGGLSTPSIPRFTAPSPDHELLQLPPLRYTVPSTSEEDRGLSTPRRERIRVDEVLD